MTLEMAVAPIALALANHPGLEEYDLSSLRYIMWGATPVTESVAELVTERTGVRWLAGLRCQARCAGHRDESDRAAAEAWRLGLRRLAPPVSDCESRGP